MRQGTHGNCHALLRSIHDISPLLTLQAASGEAGSDAGQRVKRSFQFCRGNKQSAGRATADKSSDMANSDLTAGAERGLHVSTMIRKLCHM